MSEIKYDNTVADGELFKWEKAGLTIEGLLSSYTEKQTSNGIGHVYEVENKDGINAFFAPTLLHKKLQRVATGNIVKITFTEQTKTQSGNPLKHFEVLHTQATEAKLKALGIELMKKVETSSEKAQGDFDNIDK